jgi:hypothetical protein
MKPRTWIAIMAIGLAVPAAAQTGVRSRGGVPADEAKVLLEKLASLERENQMVGEVRSRMAVEARVTPGKPYSADAITESIQVLADGNRIIRKSTARMYRDGEGRTRREQINDSGVVESISIVDPVARTSFVLQPESRTAYHGGVAVMSMKMLEEQAQFKRSAETVAMADRAKAEGALVELEKKVEQQVALPRSPAPTHGRRGRLAPAAAGETVREELGTQTVEGVAATGTRTTTTIAAGAIGNLQPIKVVSEQWFSTDLLVLLLTKHSDPRSGETTYRLVNIVRAEPDRSLFTVPADYTVKGSGIRERALR